MVEGNVIFNRKNTILMKNLTKTLIMAVLPLMFFGLFTCQPESDPAIYQAESFMDVYPDSAFLLLKNILKPEKLSAEEYAIWCLLMTQARDKNYMEHTSDSMINVAVKYFERHKDPKRLAWSYYYSGIISNELGEHVQSQLALLKARSVALEIDEPKLLGRIYENLGNLYERQELQDSVLFFYNKALLYYQQAQDSVGVGISLRNIGRSYLHFDLDSAERYYQESLQWLHNNRYMRASVLNDLGILYKQRGENELSLQYIRHSLEVSGYGIRYIHTRYLNIGELYLRMGQKDSALYYLERCLADANTRTAACASLSKLYSRIGDWKTACTYQNCYIAYIDSVYQNHKAAELAMQSEHYDKEKAIAIMQQQNLKSRFVLFLIVGIIIMILLVILLENNYRTVCEKLKSLKENEAQRQGQYTKLERQKKDLEEQLAGYKKEIEDQLEKEKQSLKLQLVSKEEEVVHLKKQIEQMENPEKNVEIFIMVKYMFLLFLLFLQSWGCVDNKKADPIVKDVSASVIADSLAYVPLETSSNCLIKYVNQIGLDDKNIFIRDDKKVLRFSIDGKFICNIGNIGEGPGEYICCGGFDIDQKKVFLWSIFAHRILVYDYDGSFLSSVEVKNRNITDMFVMNDTIYLNFETTSHSIMGRDSFLLLGLNGKTIFSDAGQITGIDKYQKRVYIRKPDLRKEIACVDSFLIYSSGTFVDTLLINCVKEKEKDFFYPKLLVGNYVFGNYQQECFTYTNKFNRQLKSGRIVQYVTSHPIPKNPAIYDKKGNEMILYKGNDMIYSGIPNDFHGIPDFYIYLDFLGFIPYYISENNTISTLLSTENAMKYQISIKGDDNPIIVVLYLK